MANYLSLEEAAAKLGIPAERLVELRGDGQVRAFRDGQSWKFPENEIDRLADDLAAGDSGSSFGSGILADDSGLAIGGKSGSVIGGDDAKTGEGSDLGIGEGAADAPATGSGSDVNLQIAEDDSKGSDVALVAGKKNKPEVLEVDSEDLKLDGPALVDDSDDGAAGSQTVSSGDSGPSEDSDPDLNLLTEDDPPATKAGAKGKTEGAGSSLVGLDLEEDSGEAVIGEDSGVDLAAGGSSQSSGASNLELMSELDDASKKASSDSGADVLSELDLLSAEQSGSGLISGIGSDLVSGSDVGSDPGGKGSDVNDALADDDDLVISDDDDDLVIDSAGSDVSVAGDSGINLMSPSDSGLSLESEPLDLAGSSISALDLGSDLGSGVGSGSGSGSGSGDGSGSAVDFQADEEFQLSPSGVGLEAEEDSGSQVIEVEDSEVADNVNFDAAGLGGDEVFGEDAGAVDGDPSMDDGDAMALDDDVMAPAAATATPTYETPFKTVEVVALGFLAGMMALCGMIMTDLVRNMWAYSEPSSPVSSLTEALIGLFGMG